MGLLPESWKEITGVLGRYNEKGLKGGTKVEKPFRGRRSEVALRESIRMGREDRGAGTWAGGQGVSGAGGEISGQEAQCDKGQEWQARAPPPGHLL